MNRVRRALAIGQRTRRVGLLWRAVRIAARERSRVPPDAVEAVEALGEAAVKALALRLLQLGDPRGEAFLGAYAYRLSDSVLGASRARRKRTVDIARLFDDMFERRLLGSIALALGPQFWTAHCYALGRPFFSYVHRLEDKTLVACAARRIRAVLEPDFPEIRKARLVEWWAHRRKAFTGHQMHYDSDDEGLGGHPLVSTVLYLDANGGPTLVTSQRPGDRVLRLSDGAAALVPPAPNRLLAFRGDLLHCVVPGRRGSGTRVTLMIAFWAELRAVRPFEAASEHSRAAVCFPTSDQARALAWARPFYDLPPCEDSSQHHRPRRTPLPSPPASVWVPVGHRAAKTVVPLPSYDTCFQGF